MMSVLERLLVRRQLRDFAPLTAETPEGTRVHATGTIRALGALLASPLSARGCVAFVARARGHTTIGGKLAPTGWLETLELTPFALACDDGTTVIIDGSHAVLAVGARAPAVRMPARETTFLARHAIHLGGARFDEALVEPGQRVTVGGTLVLVPRVTPSRRERGFRDELPTQAQLAGNRAQPLVIAVR